MLNPNLTTAPRTAAIRVTNLTFTLTSETFCAYDLHREVWVWATFAMTSSVETLLDYGESAAPRGHRRLPVKWLEILGYNPSHFESFAPTLTQYASDQLY